MESSFDQRACALFAQQYQSIAAYRGFCDRRGVTPQSVHRAVDIPAVPTDAFKHVRLFADAQEPTVTFRTSGTTHGSRGEHHFLTLEHYREAIFEPFRQFCLPDVDEIEMIVLAPSHGDAPDSSLSFMLSALTARHGRPAQFFVRRTAGGLHFDIDGAIAALRDATAAVMVLGTAFAFVEVLDRIDAPIALATGSRVMETGGLKGRTREVSRAELYEGFVDKLGVAPTHCIAEYSMTELSSQAYTDSLARNVPWDQARFWAPPWARVVAVEPRSLAPLASGRGLLRWIDLANVDSVCAVQTSDVGHVYDDGSFELFGRAEGAELRGCSLAIEELRQGLS